jgi:hypothetical protein
MAKPPLSRLATEPTGNGAASSNEARDETGSVRLANVLVAANTNRELGHDRKPIRRSAALPLGLEP